MCVLVMLFLHSDFISEDILFKGSFLAQWMDLFAFFGLNQKQTKRMQGWSKAVFSVAISGSTFTSEPNYFIKTLIEVWSGK